MCVFQRMYIFRNGGRSGRHDCTHSTDEKPKTEKDETTFPKVPQPSVAAPGSQHKPCPKPALLKTTGRLPSELPQQLRVHSSLPPKYLTCALHITRSICWIWSSFTSNALRIRYLIKIASQFTHLSWAQKALKPGLGAWSTTTPYWRISLSHDTCKPSPQRELDSFFESMYSLSLYPQRNLWILFVELVCEVYTPVSRNARRQKLLDLCSHETWTTSQQCGWISKDRLLKNRDTLCLWDSVSKFRLLPVIHRAFLWFDFSRYSMTRTVSLSLSLSLSLPLLPSLSPSVSLCHTHSLSQHYISKEPWSNESLNCYHTTYEKLSG